MCVCVAACVTYHFSSLMLQTLAVAEEQGTESLSDGDNCLAGSRALDSSGHPVRITGAELREERDVVVACLVMTRLSIRWACWLLVGACACGPQVSCVGRFKP